MPQAINNIKHEQWAMCDVCGSFYPMSQLVKQKGSLKCTKKKCLDNLQVELRPALVMSILGDGGGEDTEGADRRVVDRGFFSGFDEVNR